MAKRRADTDLNHDNWNKEESPEPEYGSGDGFMRASEDVLAQRKIKVARRRGPTNSVTTGGSEGPSVFKNFTGFGSIGNNTTPGNKLSFDFSGTKSPSQLESKKTFEASSFKLGGGDLASAAKVQNPASAITTFNFGSVNNFANAFPMAKSKTPNGVGDKSPDKPTSVTTANVEGNNTAYLVKLRVLNEGVLQWIQKHLAENININLNPVFDDYRRHFEELQKTYNPKFSKNELSSGSKGQSGSSATVKNGNASPEKLAYLGSGGATLGGATTNMDKNPSFSFSSGSKDSKLSQLDSVKNKEVGTFAFGGSSNVLSKPSTNDSSKSSDSKVASIPAFSFGSSVANESKTKDSILPSYESSDPKPKPFSFAMSSSVSSTVSSSTFSFGSSDATKSKDAPDGGAFSFGGSTGPLTFGAKDGSAVAPGSGFSFGGVKPAFSFGAGAAAAPPVNSDDQEDETPPKPEVVEVKEDDAFYEKKCKLFYKKDGVFTDKGVGTLFLKTAGDGSSKTQLVVRAATNLGNVLLNIVLNKSLPTQRMGKNNVLIVCVPNPPIDPKAKDTPVTMLIRVKTAEDADELLTQIDDHKSK